MKQLLLVIALLLVAVPVMAQDTTTLAWDYTVEDEQYLVDEGGGFKIFSAKNAAGPFTEVGSAPPTARSLTLDTSAFRGRYYFVARAWIPTMESDDSNMVSAPYKPEKPGNLRNQ